MTSNNMTLAAAAAKAMSAGQNSADWNECIADIAQEVSAGRENLLKLVETLGDALTSTDPSRRSQAVSLLVNVVSKTDRSRISAQSAVVLSQFFMSRIDDQPSIEPALNGILALLTIDVLSSHDQLAILPKIFSNVNVQSFQQSVRHTVFSIINRILENNVKPKQASDVHQIHIQDTDIVSGFIHVMDGEKDPRNLMIVFRIVKLIAQHMDLHSHGQQLVDTFFCYFPITFRGPTGSADGSGNDPFAVTADNLKRALRDAVAASSEFGPFAIPVMIEKLLSDVSGARKDAMDAIAVCAPVYGGSVFLPHISDIWDGLRKEMANPFDEKSEELAMSALRAIAKSLSATVSISTSKQTPLEAFLQPVMDDCIKSISDPELKFAKPCGKIMLAVASASIPACVFVLDKAIPLVIKSVSVEESPSKRKIMVDVLGNLVKAGRIVLATSQPIQDDTEPSVPLVTYKDTLFELFMTRALTDSYMPLRISALRGLTELMLIASPHPLLSTRDQSTTLDLVRSWLMTDVDTQTHEAATEAVEQIAKDMPDNVNMVLVPGVLDAMQSVTQSCMNGVQHNTESASTGESASVSVMSVLASCKSLARASPQICTTILSSMIHVACSCMMNMGISASAPSSKRMFVKHVLESVHEIVTVSKSMNGTPKLVLGLMDAIITAPRNGASIDHTEHLDKNSDPRHAQLDTDLVRSVCKVIAVMVRSMSHTDQTDLLRDVIVQTKQTKLDMWTNDIVMDPVLASVLSTAVANVSRDALLPIDDADKMVRDMMEYGMSLKLKCRDTVDMDDNAMLVNAYARWIASVVNKGGHGHPSVVVTARNVLNDVTTTVLLNTSMDPSQRRVVLRFYTWIAKALSLAGKPDGMDMITRIVELLSDAHIGLDAADAIGIVIRDDADDGIGTLTKPSGATHRILFKQRVYTMCIPSIVSGFTTTTDSDDHLTMSPKLPYLVALSYLVRHVPRGVLVTDLHTLLPLLVFSLTLPDTSLKLGTLETLGVMVSESPASVADQISSVIPVLVESSVYRSSGNDDTVKTDPRVRVAALRVLGRMPGRVPYSVLHPVKRSVLRGIEPALDDPKRIVRREAALTRRIWYMPTPN